MVNPRFRRGLTKAADGAVTEIGRWGGNERRVVPVSYGVVPLQVGSRGGRGPDLRTRHVRPTRFTTVPEGLKLLPFVHFERHASVFEG